MLSNNPAASSPPLDSHPPPQSIHVSVPGRALQQPQVAIPDNGYVSPRLDRRSPAPGSPFQPSPQQQPQHGLNAPRPSLSPLSEYHSGFADVDLGSSGPSRSPSPSPFSVGNHRRQQSFPNLLPLPSRSRTPSPTRKTHTRSPSEQMPYTGDGRSPRGGGGGGLASWLSGSAGAASALGISPGGSANGAASTKDAPLPETTPTRQRQPPAGHARTTSDATTPKSTMTTASRFMSALSSRFTNPASTPTSPALTSPTTTTDNDELYNLNIETALFPRSPNPSSPLGGSGGDPFSPAAYKNLQMNALGLLTKMQTAYREQATALRDLQAEQSAQSDEVEEAVTRAQHLKLQLEGMARRAHEQEEAMKQLAEELAAERRARLKAEEATRRTPSEGASMLSEDLGVDEDRRRRRRRSSMRRRKSWKSGEEGGGEEETDEDESVESESVFSRCRSPALPAQAHLVPPPSSSSDGASVVGEGAGVSAGRNTGLAVNAAPKQKGGQQMNAFQKIFKGISGEAGGGAGCGNCKGQDASVAWDTVGLLRDENRHLKKRVGDLEVAVEGALDLVNGIGL